MPNEVQPTASPSTQCQINFEMSSPLFNGESLFEKNIDIFHDENNPQVEMEITRMDIAACILPDSVTSFWTMKKGQRNAIAPIDWRARPGAAGRGRARRPGTSLCLLVGSTWWPISTTRCFFGFVFVFVFSSVLPTSSLD